MTIHLRRVTLQHDKFPTRDHYPFNLPVLADTDAVPFSTPVTLFVGENGTGKSTLLEAMARACGIHMWSNAGRARCQHNPYEALLDRCLSLDWSDGAVPGAYFGSETFRDFADSLEN
ncbi:MAG: AAA family ATPase, partial [Victivallales bacterium]|nr:AAA family ATPase [Victivallales bacterium]